MADTNTNNKKKSGLRKRWGILFLVPAVLCLVYFAVIIVYSGITTSFCLVWPVFAAIWAMMGYYAIKAADGKDGMPHAIPTFIFTSFVLFAVVFIIFMFLVLRHSVESDDNGTTDYTIVLGAKVYPNGISKTLKYRLDRALLYYEEHPETTFVLTGGTAAGDALPEALAMYNYLSMEGVPGNSMLMDIDSSSTAENIRNSISIIAKDAARRKTPAGPGDEVWDEEYIPAIAIITSDFHMMRSVRIAKELGVESVAELPVQSDRVLFLHQCVRESAAIINDYFSGNIRVNEYELPFNKI